MSWVSWTKLAFNFELSLTWTCSVCLFGFKIEKLACIWASTICGKFEPAHHAWPVCKRLRFYIATGKSLFCKKLPIAPCTFTMRPQMSAKCAFRLTFYNHFWEVQFLYGKWSLTAPMSWCDCNVSLRIFFGPTRVAECLTQPSGMAEVQFW